MTTSRYQLSYCPQSDSFQTITIYYVTIATNTLFFHHFHLTYQVMVKSVVRFIVYILCLINNNIQWSMLYAYTIYSTLYVEYIVYVESTVYRLHFIILLYEIRMFPLYIIISVMHLYAKYVLAIMK